MVWLLNLSSAVIAAEFDTALPGGRQMPRPCEVQGWTGGKSEGQQQQPHNPPHFLQAMADELPILHHSESSCSQAGLWKKLLGFPLLWFCFLHLITACCKSSPLACVMRLSILFMSFCRFCHATSQTLIDPTLQRSMGKTVANCGGILRYCGSIRLASTTAGIIHRRRLNQRFCVSENLCVCHCFFSTNASHPPAAWKDRKSPFCAFMLSFLFIQSTSYNAQRKKTMFMFKTQTFISRGPVF